MNIVIDYIKKRLLEASTWRWLIGLAVGAIGIELAPDQTDKIVAWVLGIVGSLAIIMPDGMGAKK